MRTIFLVSICFFSFACTTHAYVVVPAEQPSPFEIQTVDSIAQQQWFVGTLDGFPHTFEFLLKEPTILRAQLLVLDQPEQPKVSFIAVKEVERGVTEITRIQQKQTVWDSFVDTQSRLDFLASEVFETELEAGIYRMEVSNPVNEATYVLQVGTEASGKGYFGMLGDIRKLRSELGLSPSGVLLNRIVLIPLFALVSTAFFGWYFVRRKKLTNTN